MKRLCTVVQCVETSSRSWQMDHGSHKRDCIKIGYIRFSLCFKEDEQLYGDEFGRAIRVDTTRTGVDAEGFGGGPKIAMVAG